MHIKGVIAFIYYLFYIILICFSALIKDYPLLYFTSTQTCLTLLLAFFGSIKVKNLYCFFGILITQEIAIIGNFYLNEQLSVLILFFGFIITNGFLNAWETPEEENNTVIELENYVDLTGNYSDCCICLEDIEKGVMLDCRHKYHCDCINKWKKINPICPLCCRNLK